MVQLGEAVEDKPKLHSMLQLEDEKGFAAPDAAKNKDIPPYTTTVAAATQIPLFVQYEN